MSAIDNLEIELKFRANRVTLEKFSALLDKRAIERLDASSRDDYYYRESGHTLRYRHRGDYHEITKKAPSGTGNNFRRLESNLHLDPEKTKVKEVEGYIALEGYKPDFSINKQSRVYWDERFVYSYCVVLSTEFKELGRFIEVEARNDYPWESIEAAESWVRATAGELEYMFGLTADDLEPKSLYQLYSKRVS